MTAGAAPLSLAALALSLRPLLALAVWAADRGGGPYGGSGCGDSGMQAGQTTIERTMGITIDGSLGSSYMGSMGMIDEDRCRVIGKS